MSVHFERYTPGAERRREREKDRERKSLRGSKRERERKKKGAAAATAARGLKRGREYWLACNTESEGAGERANIKYIITFILISL